MNILFFFPEFSGSQSDLSSLLSKSSESHSSSSGYPYGEDSGYDYYYYGEGCEHGAIEDYYANDEDY
jgi:hypothetical protein